MSKKRATDGPNAKPQGAPKGMNYPGPGPKAGQSFKAGNVKPAPKPTDCCKKHR